MRLVAIILHYNKPELTDPLAKDLVNEEIETYVLDHASDPDKIPSDDHAEVIRVEPNFYFGGALNYACNTVEANRSDILWLLSNDIDLLDEHRGQYKKALIYSFRDPRVGQVHPYQTFQKQNVWTHMYRPEDLEKRGLRPCTMVDIICPLFRTKPLLTLGNLEEEKRYPWFHEIFPMEMHRGWGLDWWVAHELWKKNLGTFVLDDVGIYHQYHGTYSNGGPGMEQMHTYLSAAIHPDWMFHIDKHAKEKMKEMKL